MSTSPDARGSETQGQAPAGQQARLIISWLLVCVLLGYGVIETLITAVKLVTH